MRPWAPPLINVGGRQMMTHSVMDGDNPQAEIFSIENDAMVSIGTLNRDQGLEVDGHQLGLGPVKRYTGLQVYNRPQGPVLVAGSVLMFLGLVWHFYFRHRDRRAEKKGRAEDA